MPSPAYFPLEPLEALAKARHEIHENAPWSDQKFAAIVEVEARTIGRWREKGGLTWASADVAAVHMGFHPILIWPERWLQLDQDVVAGTCSAAEAREISKALDAIGDALARQVNQPDVIEAVSV